MHRTARAVLWLSEAKNSFPILVALLLLLCVAAKCPAQTVRIENLAATAFDGWKRVTVDKAPPYAAGLVAVPPSQVGDVTEPALYVVGRQVGLDTRVVDLKIRLAPGEHLIIDLARSKQATWTRPPLPKNPSEHFGGAATIAGVRLEFIGGIRSDGAGYAAHLRARTGPMLHTDLWLWWYPDTPAWAHGEVMVTASNPQVPDLFAEVPAGFDLRFGDAIAIVPGGTGPLIAAGTKFADGQARAMPVTFLWPRHMRSAGDFGSAVAASSLGIVGHGISQLLADGNPILPAGFSARSWTSGLLKPATERLHSWSAPACGAAPFSGTTGGQDDQVFVRGEAMLPDGVGAELVTYLSALKYANRPCHHLEADGSPIDYLGHTSPRLVLWDGRAHYSTTQSPDQLGKPRSLAQWDFPGGWYGPDVEHALFNTIAAGARYTGSYALQHLLSNIGRVYLFQWRQGGGSFGARAYGWECILAVHLWRELEDRTLAQAVADRWRTRFDALAPTLSAFDTKVGHWGPGERWQPWMESVKAYGLDLAGAQLGRPQARVIALAHAKRILAEAFVLVNGRWTTRDNVPLDGSPVTMGFFDYFGTPLAPAVVLRHEPQHEQARAIWTQLRAGAVLPKQTAWLAPGVPQ